MGDPLSWRTQPRTSPVADFSSAFRVKGKVSEWDVDDNRTLLSIIYCENKNGVEIMHLIKKRMAEGAKKYGHGLRVDDDARAYASERDSWLEHALQEALDGIVYTAAAIERHRRRGLPYKEQFLRERAFHNILSHKILICQELLLLIENE